MLAFSRLIVPVLSVLSTVYAYASPQSCSGACVTHDPALIRRSDGKYYRFGTGNRITIATSYSLNGPWTSVGSVINGASKINLAGNTDLWAPDVQLIGNTYYLYYSVSSFGSQNSAIGYATSTTLDPGSWTDQGATGVASSAGKPYNAIDANLVKTASGSYLLAFGSFWNDLYQVPMKNPPTGASGSSYNIAYNSSGTHAVEGSYQFYHGGYYYLFFSSGICCGLDSNRPARGSEYKIMVCRSSSGTGGFVDQSGRSCTAGGGTIVVQSHDNIYAPGGQGVFTDPSQGDILYYHYSNTNIGYGDGQTQFGWNKITWTNGWPTI